MEKETKPSDLERQLQILREQKTKECGNEIDEVLKKYNCRFDVSVVLREGQVIPRIGIITK